MIKIVQYNLLALVAVFVSRYLIVPMDHFNSDIGNYLWLPMGAVILSYLLFGFRVFPGVLLGYLLAEVVVEGGTNNIAQHEIISRTINTLLPLLSIWLMGKFNFSNFITDNKLNYVQLVPLVVLSAFTTTIAKVGLLYAPEQFSAGKVYFQSYVQGDILGGLLFIVVIFTVFSPALIRNKII
jgi:integral membrane sensor domain MASE1